MYRIFYNIYYIVFKSIYYFNLSLSKKDLSPTFDFFQTTNWYKTRFIGTYFQKNKNKIPRITFIIFKNGKKISK
jgi:hypothetical protein